MPRTSESFADDLAVLASDASSPLNDAIRPIRKAGIPATNEFASGLSIGDLAVDTTTGKLYVATATNGTTTSTWGLVGGQTA
jgi:hypothetical protein